MARKTVRRSIKLSRDEETPAGPALNPRTVAAGIMAAAEATPEARIGYSKLRDGSWGIRGPASLVVEGQVVRVVTRNGKARRVTVGRVMWTGADRDDASREVSIARIAGEESGRQPRQAARAPRAEAPAPVETPAPSAQPQPLAAPAGDVGPALAALLAAGWQAISMRPGPDGSLMFELRSPRA